MMDARTTTTIIIIIIIIIIMIMMGLDHEKTCLRWFANNKGEDRQLHPRSLIRTFIIRFLESIITKLAISKISLF